MQKPRLNKKFPFRVQVRTCADLKFWLATHVIGLVLKYFQGFNFLYEEKDLRFCNTIGLNDH